MHATGAHDDHGRHLTTTASAADWYQKAQRVAWSSNSASAALRRAIEADPAFSVAAADLVALTGAASAAAASVRLTTWERHHLEIVAATKRGEPRRAASLLREHLNEVGCDPLALRIVHDADAGAVADLLANRPACHD